MPEIVGQNIIQTQADLGHALRITGGETDTKTTHTARIRGTERAPPHRPQVHRERSRYTAMKDSLCLHQRTIDVGKIRAIRESRSRGRAELQASTQTVERRQDHSGQNDIATEMPPRTITIAIRPHFGAQAFATLRVVGSH